MNQAKKRRQEAAWARCRTLREKAEHDFKNGQAGHCKCCGCPAPISNQNTAEV